MIDYFATIATCLFLVGTAVQSFKSYMDGHSKGISHGLIWMLLSGFVIMTFYTIMRLNSNPILLGGYIGQFILIAIVARYKYFPRK